MATRKSSTTQAAPDRPPTQADVVAPTPMAHGNDYLGFIWQQLGEINKTLGRLEAGQISMSDRLSKVEEKTSKTKDKVDKIIWLSAGAGTAVGILISAVALLFKVFPMS